MQQKEGAFCERHHQLKKLEDDEKLKKQPYLHEEPLQGEKQLHQQIIPGEQQIDQGEKRIEQVTP